MAHSQLYFCGLDGDSLGRVLAKLSAYKNKWISVSCNAWCNDKEQPDSVLSESKLH